MHPRVVGAIAQAGGPQVSIADEPTTNLEVTIRLRSQNLLQELQRGSAIGLISVTRTLGVVSKLCGELAVRHAGQAPPTPS
jgi:ABC-type dipeptide/oligopeptide/nickel transport system ATPase component